MARHRGAAGRRRAGRGVYLYLGPSPRDADVELLALGAVLLLLRTLPFLATAVLMALVRTGGPAWAGGLAYALLAGALEVWVDVSVLTSDSSTAGIGLIMGPALSVCLVAPAVAIVCALAVGIRRLRRRRARSRVARQTGA
ncbi:hypothetical protein BRM1_09245 [Brevibacterium sp. BRM-1]|uniref:hypothetical protein n=1 Tax=Brevibacterium sp. BRM-1 TaxID=2999062 RepID=UPI00227DE5C8|nr:hypothetical protein [Brevibacterium sp. BRM-1]WAL39462.1 hypothetical protein BRM1_09245 [Brevibacterium sp. BRM-1]